MNIRKEYPITEENRRRVCDEISAETERFCAAYISDKKEILRYRLTVEECLLRWLTPEAVGKTVTLSCRKRPLCRPTIEIRYSGEAINPFMTEGNRGAGEFGESILHNLGVSPAYLYRENTNILRIELANHGKTSIRQLVYVVAASLLVGWLGLYVLPETLLQSLQENFISPLYDTFFNILSCIAGPMIFLSVAWGVYGIGDAATLSRVGKRMMLDYLRVDFLVGCVCVAAFPVFGMGLSAGGAGESQLGSIFRMILGFFPDNVFRPFEDGNTLQIIFLGFAVGVAMLFLGKRTESVARAVEQVNYLIQFFMEAISKLVPYFVFIVIVSLFWSGAMNLLASSWKLILVMLSFIAAVCIGSYAFTALRHRVPIRILVKKCAPSLLIALATASSAATFHSNMDICEKKLGVPRSLSSFGVPLAMVLHNPIAVVNNVLIAFYFAAYYQLECSVLWILTAVIVSVVLAVATPPIPGGGTVAYTMLFLQLGIPEEALAVVLALDMLTDFFITAAEMFCLLPGMVNVSAHLGVLDEEMLRSEAK